MERHRIPHEKLPLLDSEIEVDNGERKKKQSVLKNEVLIKKEESRVEKGCLFF